MEEIVMYIIGILTGMIIQMIIYNILQKKN